MDALKRVDAGLAVPEVCRELGISTATFYKWRSKYGGMDTSMMARMKELESENARLKKMYIEEKLKAEIVTEALAKKWRGRLTDVRWPSGQSEIKPSPFVWRAKPLGLASLATATKPRTMPRTSSLPTGSSS